MGDQEDIMLTFRQKIQHNNTEHMFFRQEVDSWRDDIRNRQEAPTTLEDIRYYDSSDDEDSSDPADGLLKKGKTCLEKGEFAKAISTFTAAISKNRTAKYYTARALAYLKRCNLIEAEKDCTEAIRLDPKFTKAYIRRALARKLLGKCKESCNDMEITLELDPDNAIVAMEYEAMLDYLRKNLSGGNGRKVEQEKQETAIKMKQLGNDLVSKCQYKKAIAKFTSAIELNPNDPTFYANRAICHMKLKDFVSAEKDCTMALEQDGSYAKVYLRRARVRKCLGKLYESRQDFYSTFELTHDDKVLEELEEVEAGISQMEKHRRDKGEEVENHDMFSIMEKDELGYPKLVRLDCIKLKSLQRVDDKKSTKGKTLVDELPRICPENDEQKFQNEKKSGIQREMNISQCRMQQTNTEISIPSTRSAISEDISSKYDIHEVSPMKRDDQIVKFTGPFIRVIVEDGKFAAPEKLLEIPDNLMRNLLPR